LKKKGLPMKYGFFTPYSELSENLKTIRKADEEFEGKE
jgi:ABC-type glycerol-3-phosphate transport system substrate-binding protein